jgi:hypothetical protein
MKRQKRRKLSKAFTCYKTQKVQLFLSFVLVITVNSAAIGKKVKEAQRQRQAAAKPTAMEMETAE